MNRKELGNWGEKQAKVYLEQRGFNIIEENFRCRIGEIDLIGWDGEYLVFVEVKTRRSTNYGFPAQAVDKRKQIKYYNLALFYIKQKGLLKSSLRFDIVEVLAKPGAQYSINHIPNAFQSAGGKFYNI